MSSPVSNLKFANVFIQLVAMDPRSIILLSIKFLGGAGTVTGSKFLVSSNKQKILVDCGLFQGLKELRLENWKNLPVDVREIQTVLLTHAHLDHTGYLPLLRKQGFSGKIFCSAPTAELTKVILFDSAKLQEEDATLANRDGFTKHSPAKPLYRSSDVDRILRYFQAVRPGAWTKICDGIRFRMQNSGHILGSVFIELDVHGKTIVFSGDLGRKKPLTLNAPQVLHHADYLVTESTYGDRIHKKQDTLKVLAGVINETFAQKGQVIIPSFAVGRTQDLLYLFSVLKRKDKIPPVPIYLDSPMGIHATEILLNHPDWHKLSPAAIQHLREGTIMVRTQAESQKLLRSSERAIIIAGSGMASGGRVLHHLEKRLPHHRNTVLLVGFQAPGTRGKLLLDGAQEIKIHGKYVPVKAKVTTLFDLSAHADQTEIIDWLSNFKKAPQSTFIVHGEPQASDNLRLKIKDTLGWHCVVPQKLSEHRLT